MKLFSAIAFLLTASAVSSHAAIDGLQIEQLTGLKGSLNESEGVFKVTSPRSDIKVTVDGRQMPPFMGQAGTIPGTI